jgi:hypothetical protein
MPKPATVRSPGDHSPAQHRRRQRARRWNERRARLREPQTGPDHEHQRNFVEAEALARQQPCADQRERRRRRVEHARPRRPEQVHRVEQEAPAKEGANEARRHEQCRRRPVPGPGRVARRQFEGIERRREQDIGREHHEEARIHGHARHRVAREEDVRGKAQHRGK